MTTDFTLIITNKCPIHMISPCDHTHKLYIAKRTYDILESKRLSLLLQVLSILYTVATLLCYYCS